MQRERLSSGTARRCAAAAFVAVALASGLTAGTPRARADDGLEFTNWLSSDANVASGSLIGKPVSLSGTFVNPASNLDGRSTVFAGGAFSPPLPLSDAIEFRGFTTGYRYALTFSAPVVDPVIDLASLGSTIDFASGTAITRVSGDPTFTVTGSSVSGASVGGADPGGTIRLTGTFSSVSFTATYRDFADRPDGIYLQVGARPPAPPPPLVPSPPTPAPPAPPSINSIKALTELVAGEPTILAADVEGARELDWDLDADGRFDVSCPGNQPAVSFRPPWFRGARPAAAGAIVVRAVGDGGASTLSKPLVYAPPRTPSTLPVAAQREIAQLVGKHAVFICTSSLTGPHPINLSDRFDPGFKCLAGTLVTGPLRAFGCFSRITKLDDIKDEVARQAVARLLSEKVPIQAGDYDAALEASDGVVSISSSVSVNGVVVRPAGSAQIVIDRQLGAILSSNAEISVGGIPLRLPRALEWVAHGKGNRIPLGTFQRDGGGRTTLGALGIDGDVRVDLVGGPGLDAHAELRTNVHLPDWLGGFPVAVDVRLNGNGRLDLDSMHIGPASFRLGALSITDFRIDYRQGLWRGQMQLCVSPRVCIDFRPVQGVLPAGGVEIGPDSFRVFANMNFDPALPLFTGVDLNRVGAGLAEPPLRLLGGAKITAAGIYEIEGAIAFAFPSAGAPYRLERDVVGNNFPPHQYGYTFTRFTLAAGAEAFVKVPLLGRVRLGSGHFLYEYPGYVSFGGGLDESFFGVIRIIGGMSGEFDLSSGHFNLHGDAKSCIADIPILNQLCWGSVVQVSDVGVGGCVEVGPVMVGGGVHYHPYRVELHAIDGCRWSVFRNDNVRPRGRATQAEGSRIVHISRGDPSREIELRGADGAPRVKVTTARGETLESSDGPGFTRTAGIRILRSERLKLTVIGLVDPAPGDQRIDLLPGSPAIERVRQANAQPPARITATLSRRGSRAALRYRIRPREGQRVRFFEAGPDGAREIGAASGNRGRLSFTPAPGHGKRRVEARFELAGLPAERRTVARFRPPSPLLPRPEAMRVHRDGTRLRVDWRPVRGATGYEVSAELRTGGRRVVRTARHSLVVAKIPRWSAGRVTVQALAPLRGGLARRLAFTAVGKRPRTVFIPLPRAPRGAAR